MRSRKVHYRTDVRYIAVCSPSGHHLVVDSIEAFINSEHKCKNCERIMKARGIIKDEPNIDVGDLIEHGDKTYICTEKGKAEEVVEDPRIAALQGNCPVTIENAWVGAEVVSMADGLGKITHLDNDPSFPILCYFGYAQSFRPNGSLYNLSEVTLYWPNGIVTKKPRETEVIEVTVIPAYINGTQYLHIKKYDTVDRECYNGPSQTIKITVYKDGE